MIISLFIDIILLIKKVRKYFLTIVLKNLRHSAKVKYE